MPRIQTFVTEEVDQKIRSRIERKRMEGASEKEANTSNETADLIVLGLRVKELQESKQEDGFSELAFYKAIFEAVIKTKVATEKILGIASLLNEVQGKDSFKWSSMAEEIRLVSDEEISKLFPMPDEGDDEE